MTIEHDKSSRRDDDNRLHQQAFHYLAQIYPILLLLRARRNSRNTRRQCKMVPETATEILGRLLKTTCKKAIGEYIFKTLFLNGTFLS